MTAEILSVGTELLLGDIVNTNAAFLSRELAKLGISVYHQATVGDNHDRLTAQLGQSFAKADCVIISGGLGPTQDDITKAVAAEYFGRGLTMHEESLERIKRRFAHRELPVNVERNAIIIEGAEALPNDNGSAPGIIVEQDGKTLILLPGPPHEMKPMFSQYAVSFLRTKTNSVLFSRTLKIIGVGESKVELLLQDLIDEQTNPTISPYAKFDETQVRITASAPNETAAQALLEPLAKEIYRRLDSHVYAEDDTTLAEIVVKRLREGGKTLATAESCTGGLIAADIVGVPGSSAVFREGLTTYSNDAKISRLQVDAKLIAKHGAVSAEVAAAMAEGVAKTSGAEIGLSTTGIAGPDGGTAEKPVGLVYVGLHMDGETKTAKFQLSGNRNEIRERAKMLGLNFLRSSYSSML